MTMTTITIENQRGNEYRVACFAINTCCYVRCADERLCLRAILYYKTKQKYEKMHFFITGFGRHSLYFFVAQALNRSSIGSGNYFSALSHTICSTHHITHIHSFIHSFAFDDRCSERRRRRSRYDCVEKQCWRVIYVVLVAKLFEI